MIGVFFVDFLYIHSESVCIFANDNLNKKKEVMEKDEVKNMVERIMKPTIGRIVIYKTTSEDRRFMRNMDCNEQLELPAVIVSVHNETYVNLQVFADGPTTLWRKSILNGTGEGCWHWPIIGK